MSRCIGNRNINIDRTDIGWRPLSSCLWAGDWSGRRWHTWWDIVLPKRDCPHHVSGFGWWRWNVSLGNIKQIHWAFLYKCTNQVNVMWTVIRNLYVERRVEKTYLIPAQLRVPFEKLTKYRSNCCRFFSPIQRWGSNFSGSGKMDSLWWMSIEDMETGVWSSWSAE